MLNREKKNIKHLGEKPELFQSPIICRYLLLHSDSHCYGGTHPLIQPFTIKCFHTVRLMPNTEVCSRGRSNAQHHHKRLSLPPNFPSAAKSHCSLIPTDSAPSVVSFCVGASSDLIACLRAITFMRATVYRWMSSSTSVSMSWLTSRANPLICSGQRWKE